MWVRRNKKNQTPDVGRRLNKINKVLSATDLWIGFMYKKVTAAVEQRNVYYAPLFASLSCTFSEMCMNATQTNTE